MEEFKVKIIGREIIAEDTLELKLEKPEELKFEAGQAIELFLQNPKQTDDKGNSRELSIVSGPHEEFVMIATRLRDSAFKQGLKDLVIGDEVVIAGPFGSLTLHEKVARPAVFLAGGIGITPFVSMIRSALDQDLPYEMDLFYSNRTPELSSYLNELLALGETHGNFSCVPTMTDMDKSKSDWSGEEGFITFKMLKKHGVDVSKDPIYYICGPQGFVKAMYNMLTEAEISKDDIRLEEFYGY